MTATALTSLNDVLAQLKTRHLAGNELALGPVCTRVMLRTGANLRTPRPDQLHDPVVLAKVVGCLAEMGYPL